MEAKQSNACWRKCALVYGCLYGMGERQQMRKEESWELKEGRERRTEGGRVRETQQACPLSHHAPGISYLKFRLSAPQKPFHTANKDALGRSFSYQGTH